MLLQYDCLLEYPVKRKNNDQKSLHILQLLRYLTFETPSYYLSNFSSFGFDSESIGSSHQFTGVRINFDNDNRVKRRGNL